MKKKLFTALIDGKTITPDSFDEYFGEAGAVRNGNRLIGWIANIAVMCKWENDSNNLYFSVLSEKTMENYIAVSTELNKIVLKHNSESDTIVEQLNFIMDIKGEMVISFMEYIE